MNHTHTQPTTISFKESANLCLSFSNHVGHGNGDVLSNHKQNYLLNQTFHALMILELTDIQKIGHFSVFSGEFRNPETYLILKRARKFSPTFPI